MQKEAPRSAFVDLVMADASEERKAAASRRWFRFLKIALKIAAEEEKRRKELEEAEKA